ncbi:hypothetical protein [Halomarina litorea]|uniref:hypothetical protein n=1 Tax=Halomarina litorea TaxID=2961595 RepID=UPI0020C4ACFF|nr:hypothetical protein [Halomarina sp. BCD28]
MRGPSPLALLVVCLVVLAGCNGLAAGGDDTEMPDVTPADVPRDLHGGSIAPGLTRQQVVNASALIASHREVTANRSMTVVERNRQETANGTVLQGYEAATRYAENRSRFATSADLFGVRYAGSEESMDRYDAWSNGTTTYLRRVVDGSPEYDRAPGSRGAVTDYRLHQLEQILLNLDVTTVRELGERGGYDTYSVRGTLESEDRPDGQARLVVDERGLVREFRTTAHRSDYRDGETNVTDTRSTRFEAIGNTTVSRPDWVAGAIEEFASREYVAPGVTTERVVDAYELRSAHEEALRGQSVTRRQANRRVTVNGEVAERSNQTLWVAADRTDYRYHRVQYEAGAPTWRSEEWSNGTVGYERSIHDNETEFHRYHGERERRAYLDVPSGIERDGETTVTDLGDGRYRVVVTDFENPNRVLHYGGERSVIDLHVELVVRESGLVERYEQSYSYTEGAENPTYRVRRVTTFTDVGSTRVERPDWFAAAVNATSR